MRRVAAPSILHAAFLPPQGSVVQGAFLRSRCAAGAALAAPQRRWAHSSGGGDAFTPDTASSYFAWLARANDATTAWLPARASFPSLIDAAAEALESLHVDHGLPWPGLFMGLGCVARLCLMVFSLYGERAVARLHVALPELGPSFKAYEAVYNDPSAKALDVHVAATKVKAERREVFARYQTSNIRAMAPLLGAPFVGFGFAVVARCVRRFDSVDAAVPFPSWISGFSACDPTYILPVTACLLTMANAELALRGRRDTPLVGRSTSSNTLVWAVRGGAFAALSVATQLRAATLVYWIGLGATGLLQPALLRWRWFRAWYGIPDPPAVSAAHASTAFVLADEESALMGRFRTLLPRLSSLLSPAAAQRLNQQNKQLQEASPPAASGAGRSKRTWKK